MASVEEYIEAYVRQRFFREEDEDENLIRSLPAFATALAVVIASLSLSLPRLAGYHGRLGGAPFALALCALLGALGAVACLTLTFWPRRHLGPATESEIVGFADAARAYHAERSPDLAGPALEDAVRDDVRAFLLPQLVEATEVNRARNRRAKAWRGLALVAVTISLLFNLALLATIFIPLPGDRDAQADSGLASLPGQPLAPRGADHAGDVRAGDARAGDAGAAPDAAGAARRLGLPAPPRP